MYKKKFWAVVLASVLTLSCSSPAIAEDFSVQNEAASASEFTDGNHAGFSTEEAEAQPSPATVSGETDTETNTETDTKENNDGTVFEDISEADNDIPEESIIDVLELTPTPEASLTPAASETDASFSSVDTDAVSSGGTSTSKSAGYATITCTGKSAGAIRVTAKITKKISSADNYYYLFRVNPDTGKLTKRIAKKTKPSGKNKKISFYLKTSGHPEYIQGKYVLAVKDKSGSFSAVSSAKYVSNPEKAASCKAAYQLPATKKGLQTTDYAQIDSTKSKAIFFNLSVSTVLTKSAESVPYTYNGTTYYFNKIGGYTSLVSRCNDRGIPVTVQLLLDWTSSTKDLAYAGSRTSAAYYAWDSLSAASRQKMEALFSFLSELFGSDSCYVTNWILGNEINSSSIWNYAGNVTQSQYVTLYSEAFRCLYNAVRSVRANSKCFICLDFYWNTTRQGYSGKSILNAFHATLKNLQPNVNWNLAYHAYPHPLTDTRFWLNSHPADTTNTSTSPVITLNNLSVLTNYIKKNFGTKTRIILSEQGFTSAQGEDAQAAAIALGYYIAACNPMIDTFHIRSYQDESHEVAQGLAVGIKGKKAFNVFKYMDTSRSLSYTSSYLNSQVGSSWKKKIPYYNTKRLYNLYRK